MELVVTVTYLLQQYTYNVTTEDAKRFVCTREELATGEEAGAPPEKMRIVLGEAPASEVWGKSLADLYHQLAEKITDHLPNDIVQL